MFLKCFEATQLENLFQQHVMSCILETETQTSGTPHLLVAEKLLLNLATYPNCTDGILYSIPLIFEVNGEIVLYLRYEFIHELL